MSTLFKAATIILILTPRITLSQSDTTSKAIHLEELIVNGSKFEELKKESPFRIEVVGKKKIEFQNASTSAGLLEQTGNVFVQRSQAGGGSPVIRGFEASKVLIVLDGVRINNAIFRSGHLQNLLRIDQNMLERVDIIFGPSSVIYGSDALGGAMHFKTKSPVLNQKNINVYTRYATVNNEKTIHLDFNLGGKKVAALSSLTYSDFGDLRMGKNANPAYSEFGLRKKYVSTKKGEDSELENANIYLQKLSAYKQIDGMEKIQFKTGHFTHTLNTQFSLSSNVPRYDRLTETSNGNLRFAEWYYGPEGRALGSYQIDLGKNRYFDKGTVIGAVQLLSENRNSRRVGNPYRKIQSEFVSIESLNADFQKKISNNTWQFGAELIRNKVSSEAHLQHITNDSDSRKAETRYPDGGSHTKALSIYLSNIQNFNKRLILNTGLRFNASSLDARFNDKTFFPFPYDAIEQRNNALSGNVGLVYNPQEKTKFSLLGSTGYRTPNVDDLAKVFDSVGGLLIVPNPNLKPEYSYNSELSVEHKFYKWLKIEGTYFYTAYQNVIVIDDFALGDKTQIEYDGIDSRIVASQNKGKGHITGWNINLRSSITQNVSFISSLNATKGLLGNGQPLDHIPPMFGKTAINYQNQKLQTEFFVQFNSWKKLEDYSDSGEDNLKYATPEGMPAWWTLNFRSAFDINKNFKLQLAMENILDRRYRVFASGISAPGRNVILNLRIFF